jgi:hypothetical protein
VTLRLTAECSTAELQGTATKYYQGFAAFSRNIRKTCWEYRVIDVF